MYVAPFPGPGDKSRTSTSTAVGGYPRWRRDGRELFYLASDNTLMAVAVDGRVPSSRQDRPGHYFERVPRLGEIPLTSRQMVSAFSY